MSRFSARGRSKLGKRWSPCRNTDPASTTSSIVGGAVAGASTAIVLKRGNPKLRILVVEKTERFDWKVGESTVEVSSYFLTRVLKQWSHLVRDQLPKQAFRYWFFNDDVTCLREASETGPTQLARTPSFQLDRAKLDEHLLEDRRARRAPSSGARRRSPRGRSPRRPGRGNTLTVEKSDGTTATVSCRWLVDATGRQAMLARKRGGVTPIESHPTAAIWVRYNDVKDMDGIALAGTDPADPWHRAVIAPRRLATNHFTGWGYWIWFIPLHDGEMSVGLVWDKRLVTPEGTTPLDKLTRFLDTNPLTRADDRGRGRRRGRLPLLRAPALLRRQVHRPRAGPASATPADSSIPSTRRASTRCPSRSGRARG